MCWLYKTEIFFFFPVAADGHILGPSAPYSNAARVTMPLYPGGIDPLKLIR